jgi:hypothetical protein
MTSRSLDIGGLSNHAAVWDNRCHAVNHPSRVRRSMTNTDCSEPQEGRDSLRAEERHAAKTPGEAGDSTIDMVATCLVQGHELGRRHE